MSSTRNENEGVYYPLLFTQADILSDSMFRDEGSAIAVSSTATGARSYGLLRNIEYTFPYARFTPGRSGRISEHFMTGPKESHKIPGEVVEHLLLEGIDVAGPAIMELVTRVVPGNPWPHNTYTRNIVISKKLDSELIELVRSDTVQSRTVWFMDALKKMEDAILHSTRGAVKNVYVPSGTGSSTTDEFWTGECVPMLSALAKRVQQHGVKVYVVARRSLEKFSGPNSFTRMIPGEIERGTKRNVARGLLREHPKEKVDGPSFANYGGVHPSDSQVLVRDGEDVCGLSLTTPRKKKYRNEGDGGKPSTSEDRNKKPIKMFDHDRAGKKSVNRVGTGVGEDVCGLGR